MICEYVQNQYNVPACIGRRVVVAGRPGVIAEDRGHYIGVNFDDEKPGVIASCHPTWRVSYLGMGKVRNLTKSQQRYRRYLEYGDSFQSFLDFCRWDADVQREALVRANMGVPAMPVPEAA
ncbi:hypothetical protein [Microbulbifer sp. SAOS-129_SWC]|uniref:hypothetical protein n=1 Tax=Microbulbifer sp. SAOS-129_SWC TaxID=3145235 RepID=UPI0032170CB6